LLEPFGRVHGFSNTPEAERESNKSNSLKEKQARVGIAWHCAAARNGAESMSWCARLSSNALDFTKQCLGESRLASALLSPTRGDGPATGRANGKVEWARP
jgi:hypothetical protein